MKQLLNTLLIEDDTIEFMKLKMQLIYLLQC